MTTSRAGKALENAFDADVSAEAIQDGGADGTGDPPPIVVFLTPGIRSDKGWAYAFTHSNWPSAREIIPEIVSGPSDLGITDLILRYRMNAFRDDFRDQIAAALKKHVSNHGKIDVAFICHSMGSSIFSDIIIDISKNIEDNGYAQLKYIIFLGSIARRTKSVSIGQSCSIFLNDVGQKDILPILAWMINPFKYDPVGRFGFGRTVVTDRIFPNNDHSNCTEETHMSQWVVPLIETGFVKKPEYKPQRTRYNLYRFAHKIIWLSLTLLLLWLALRTLNVW